MRVIQLSDLFYEKYGDKPEILNKEKRPYLCLTVTVGEITYAIPFRHHIRHQYAFYTIGEAGLDFTKSVIIESPDYIANTTVRVDTVEWRIVNANEEQIIYQFKRYLRRYERAKRKPDLPANEYILAYSALQYFEKHKMAFLQSTEYCRSAHFSMVVHART